MTRMDDDILGYERRVATLMTLAGDVDEVVYACYLSGYYWSSHGIPGYLAYTRACELLYLNVDVIEDVLRGLSLEDCNWLTYVFEYHFWRYIEANKQE